MSQSLVGSRYDLHVVRSKPPGVAEQDYYAIHDGDAEEVADGAPSRMAATLPATSTRGRWAPP